MVRASKTDGPHLYINILDFKDKTEQEIIFKKVQDLLRDYNTKVRVY